MWLSKYFWVIRYNLFYIILSIAILLMFCAIVDIIDHLPARFSEH